MPDTAIVHELGHGLAALLTGGASLRFVVFPDGAGLATTAGYLGAALIRLGRPRGSRLALGALGAGLALLSLLACTSGEAPGGALGARAAALAWARSACGGDANRRPGG